MAGRESLVPEIDMQSSRNRGARGLNIRLGCIMLDSVTSVVAFS